MHKTISVIVPVYNVEKYLKECLNSVIQQTYSNLDIIVVDDGSTDSSGSICDQYKKKDTRIRVIHQKNMGLSGARNTGIEIAQGEYITFLDSDDYLESDALENLIRALEKYNCDISVGSIEYCDELGKKIFIKETLKEKEYIGKEQIYNLLTGFEINTMAWGKLYKKKLFNNIRYPLNKYHEDVFTTYKLLDLSSKTVVIPDIIVHYRQVSSSIMHSKFTLKHLDALEGTKERMEFIKHKYAKYVKYAYAEIPYVCAKIFERMIQANYQNINIEKEIQGEVRKYLYEFLFYSNSRLMTKLFCLCLCINTNMSRNFYKLVSKI